MESMAKVSMKDNKNKKGKNLLKKIWGYGLVSPVYFTNRIYYLYPVAVFCNILYSDLPLCSGGAV